MKNEFQDLFDKHNISLLTTYDLCNRASVFFWALSSNKISFMKDFLPRCSVEERLHFSDSAYRYIYLSYYKVTPKINMLSLFENRIAEEEMPLYFDKIASRNQIDLFAPLLSKYKNNDKKNFIGQAALSVLSKSNIKSVEKFFKIYNPPLNFTYEFSIPSNYHYKNIATTYNNSYNLFKEAAKTNQEKFIFISKYYPHMVNKLEYLDLLRRSISGGNVETMVYLLKDRSYGFIRDYLKFKNEWIEDSTEALFSIKESISYLNKDNVSVNVEIINILKEHGIYEQHSVTNLFKDYLADGKIDLCMEMIEKDTLSSEIKNLNSLLDQVFLSGNFEIMKLLDFDKNELFLKHCLSKILVSIGEYKHEQEFIDKYISLPMLEEIIDNKYLIDIEGIKQWVSSQILNKKLEHKTPVVHKKNKI